MDALEFYENYSRQLAVAFERHSEKISKFVKNGKNDEANFLKAGSSVFLQAKEFLEQAYADASGDFEKAYSACALRLAELTRRSEALLAAAKEKQDFRKAAVEEVRIAALNKADEILTVYR